MELQSPQSAKDPLSEEKATLLSEKDELEAKQKQASISNDEKVEIECRLQYIGSRSCSKFGKWFA